MKVYRIEDSEGIGPFVRCTGVVRYWDKTLEDQEADPSVNGVSPYSHPNPSAEFGKQIGSSYYCSFKDIEQLLRWFPHGPGREKMQEADFKLRIYETEDYMEGKRQVVFKKSTAIPIGLLDLVTFEPI